MSAPVRPWECWNCRQRETKQQFPSFPRVERPRANPGSRRGLSCMRALRSLVLALSAGYTARAEPEPEVRRARPRAAILLFGLAFRNPAQCGPSVVARVAAPLRDAGFDVVTLAHSPTVAKLQYARTKEACGALGTRVRDLAPFGADRVVTHEQAHIDARLASLDAADGGGGAARFLARGDHDSEAGAKGHAVRNALRALWSLREVTRAAERAAPDAALWVMLRADLEYLTNVTDARALAADARTGSTPSWHCNGGVNDRVFAGPPAIAREFGLRYDRLGECASGSGTRRRRGDVTLTPSHPPPLAFSLPPRAPRRVLQRDDGAAPQRVVRVVGAAVRVLATAGAARRAPAVRPQPAQSGRGGIPEHARAERPGGRATSPRSAAIGTRRVPRGHADRPVQTRECPLRAPQRVRVHRAGGAPEHAQEAAAEQGRLKG